MFATFFRAVMIIILINLDVGKAVVLFSTFNCFSKIKSQVSTHDGF